MQNYGYALISKDRCRHSRVGAHVCNHRRQYIRDDTRTVPRDCHFYKWAYGDATDRSCILWRCIIECKVQHQSNSVKAVYHYDYPRTNRFPHCISSSATRRRWRMPMEAMYPSRDFCCFFFSHFNFEIDHMTYYTHIYTLGNHAQRSARLCTADRESNDTGDSSGSILLYSILLFPLTRDVRTSCCADVNVLN